jgi:hypothetical protein
VNAEEKSLKIAEGKKQHIQISQSPESRLFSKSLNGQEKVGRKT